MKKETFCIVSQDRHRDDIIYLFVGTFEEAKETARELFSEISRRLVPKEEEFEDGNYRYSINACDGDYDVSIYTPVKLTLSTGKSGEGRK